jgi:hypothetical protein
MMSEHQKHTEFLRQCLLYDDSSERHQLEEKLTRIHRDLCCVKRAAWLMAILAALAMVGLVYPAILMQNFPYNMPQFIVNLVLALVVGSLISLLAFVGLWIVYRKKLDQRREECRQKVMRLLKSRLGKPVTASYPVVNNLPRVI